MGKSASPSTKRTAEKLTEHELDTLREYVEVLEGNLVRITRQLDADLYAHIKLVLERLGGVYMTGRKRFSFTIDPTPLLRHTIESRQLPEQNPLDFYYSTPDVVESVLRELEWGDSMSDLLWEAEQQGRRLRVLEPNAGLGHLADAIRARYPMVEISVCELDPYRRAVLLAKGYPVVAEDFLQYHPPPQDYYGAIVMNPPFTINGDSFTFIRHIQHAEELLIDSPWSKLVSVASASFAKYDRYHTFHVHVLQYGSYEDLPQGAFVEAGTTCETVLITLSTRKNHFYASWDEPDSEDGFLNKRLKTAWMYISVDAMLNKACEQLVRDMIEGRLPVYSNGVVAPTTRECIFAFCQQVEQQLLSEYRVYISFTPADLDAMQDHILFEYRLARGQYGAFKRAEWEREQARRGEELRACVEQTEKSITSYSKLLATHQNLLSRHKNALQQWESSCHTIPDFQPAAEPSAPGEQAHFHEQKEVSGDREIADVAAGKPKAGVAGARRIQLTFF